MKNLFILLFLAFLCSHNFLRTDCYRNMRFSALNSNSNNASKKNIAEELKGVNDISQQLINNDKEEGEEDEEDDDDEELEKASFDNIAHKSIENTEEEAVVDLENAEMENLLDNEIFRVIQERLKKLWYIGLCRRDYSNLCPIGWSKSAYDDNLCIPPAYYEGQCRSMDFSNSQPKDKELFAWKCEVEWPCVKSPSQKVMEKCPVRWINIGNNLCIAPEDYIGQCPPAMDFSNFSYEMRVRWAVLCNFEWPADLEKKVFTTKRKLMTSTGGPIEESGDVLKMVHTYN